MRNFFGKRSKGTVQKGNVMTPLNWMCGISETAVLSVAANNHDNWLGIGSFILGVLVIVFYGIMYLYFSIKDPDRLQSEQFNLDTQEMRLSYQTKSDISAVIKVTEGSSAAHLVQATIQNNN